MELTIKSAVERNFAQVALTALDYSLSHLSEVFDTRASGVPSAKSLLHVMNVIEEAIIESLDTDSPKYIPRKDWE